MLFFLLRIDKVTAETCIKSDCSHCMIIFTPISYLIKERVTYKGNSLSSLLNYSLIIKYYYTHLIFAYYQPLPELFTISGNSYEVHAVKDSIS